MLVVLQFQFTLSSKFYEESTKELLPKCVRRVHNLSLILAKEIQIHEATLRPKKWSLMSLWSLISLWSPEKRMYHSDVVYTIDNSLPMSCNYAVSVFDQLVYIHMFNGSEGNLFGVVPFTSHVPHISTQEFQHQAAVWLLMRPYKFVITTTGYYISSASG